MRTLKRNAIEICLGQCFKKGMLTKDLRVKLELTTRVWQPSRTRREKMMSLDLSGCNKRSQIARMLSEITAHSSSRATKTSKKGYRILSRIHLCVWMDLLEIMGREQVNRWQSLSNSVWCRAYQRSNEKSWQSPRCSSLVITINELPACLWTLLKGHLIAATRKTRWTRWRASKTKAKIFRTLLVHSLKHISGVHSRGSPTRCWVSLITLTVSIFLRAPTARFLRCEGSRQSTLRIE